MCSMPPEYLAAIRSPASILVPADSAARQRTSPNGSDNLTDAFVLPCGTVRNRERLLNCAPAAADIHGARNGLA
jgi:hypothetical protein